MKKDICFNLIVAVVMSVSMAIFSISVYAEDTVKPKPTKPAGTESKPSDAQKKPNMNQIAFIAKFDKNGDGRVDRTEFKGEHFSVYDKNGDGFIDPLEAPEGQTAY